MLSWSIDCDGAAFLAVIAATSARWSTLIASCIMALVEKHAREVVRGSDAADGGLEKVRWEFCMLSTDGDTPQQPSLLVRWKVCNAIHLTDEPDVTT